MDLTFPPRPAMDWSSLMPELVYRVAGMLLDTADVDCYMALRAVCHNRRAATADPTNTMDPRFRPHNWIMLHYQSHHGDDNRVLLNTETGRFHCREIPMLRDYYVVSITTDGLLVLVEKQKPEAVCVLNPFTGYMLRFAAPMRPNVVAAAVSGSTSTPIYLSIYCSDPCKLYGDHPGSEEFVRYKKKYSDDPMVRKAVHGRVAIGGHRNVLPPLPATVVAKIAHLMTPFADLPSGNQIGGADWPACFVVESAGETLVIFKLENRRMEVFKMDKDGNTYTLEQVNSIGSRAIFIGGACGSSSRCLSLDAHKFRSNIEANCIYLTPLKGWPYTEIYHLQHGIQGQSSVIVSTEMLEQMMSGQVLLQDRPTFICNPLNSHPWSIIFLLSLYTLNMPSKEMSKVLQYEKKLLRQFQSGELSREDFLQSPEAGIDHSDD